MSFGAPASDISRTRTDRSLSIDETPPSQLVGSTAARMSALAAPPNNKTVDIRRICVDRMGNEGENHQQPQTNCAGTKLESSSHEERSQHDPKGGGSTTSANNGKIRLPRPTAAARRSKAPPPIELIHEDVFPPPDLRNARQQMSIDQLRRNGQLEEHNDEAALAEQLSFVQKSMPSSLPPAADLFSTQSSAQQCSLLQSTQVCNSLQRIGRTYGQKQQLCGEFRWTIREKNSNVL